MGDARPALDLAHRHDVDAILVVTDREADELDDLSAGAALDRGSRLTGRGKRLGTGNRTHVLRRSRQDLVVRRLSSLLTRVVRWSVFWMYSQKLAAPPFTGWLIFEPLEGYGQLSRQDRQDYPDSALSRALRS